MEQASVFAAHDPWYKHFNPICFPLNGAAFQIYLLIIAYSCLHYKYFWKAPLVTPQFHLPLCNYQIAVVYSYMIAPAGLDVEQGTTYSYFLILFLLLLKIKLQEYNVGRNLLMKSSH